MPDFFHPLTWSRNWAKRRLQNHPACGLHSCSGSQTLWQRLLSRRTGTFLQGVFYCQPQCLETALTAQLSRLHVLAPAPLPPNRVPLGLLMVARGKLTYSEVLLALDAQRRARSGKIGDWIEKLGFASEQDVTTALALQWGCPVASSPDPTALESASRIPLALLDAFQMLPLNYAAITNTLYIAFGERVDHAALYAIERILDCRTQPCVAPRKTIARHLEHLRQQSRPDDLEFGPTNDFAEMSRIASSYMARLSPDEVRLSRMGCFIWLCLKTGNSATNLLFRLKNQLRDHSSQRSAVSPPIRPMQTKSWDRAAFLRNEN
jgi:type II secretion system (T2SS) protein E